MDNAQKPSTLLVIIAFALVYIVWGSTYFFIQMALHGIPAFMVGALRFITAGLLMFIWCVATGRKLWIWKHNYHSIISGLLLLFGGTGCLIWAERTVPSAMTAILVSAAPVWFVLMDTGHWRENFSSRSTIVGIIIGFLGILALFAEPLTTMFRAGAQTNLGDMLILILGSVLWTAGSLYSKYKGGAGDTSVSTTWQMLAAGIAFIPCSLLSGEANRLDWNAIPTNCWLAIGYLVVFGSIVAFSAYVWLLQVRPATQVSTYAYVNPVIAVILGTVFAQEKISLFQIGGLVVILGSVLLINLAKYRRAKQEIVMT